MIDIHNIDLKEFFHEDKIINHLLDEEKIQTLNSNQKNSNN